MIDWKTRMSFLSSADQLQMRRKLAKEYTYLKNSLHVPPKKVVSNRVKKISKLIPINIASPNVKTLLSEAGHSEFIQPPPDPLIYLKKGVADSNMRLLRVNNGTPFVKVIEPSVMPYSRRWDPEMHEFPPSLVRSKEKFACPSDTFNGTVSDKARDEYNSFIDSLNEENSEKYDSIADEAHWMEQRRERALKAKYNDFTKYGLEESRVRANRQSSISALKWKRKEPWWNGFVTDVCNEFDLGLIEEVSNIYKWDDIGVQMLLSGVKNSNSRTEEMKKLLIKANDHGRFMEQAKLMLVMSSDTFVLDKITPISPRRRKASGNMR